MLMVSAALLTLESTTRLLDPMRSFVGTFVSPLRFVAETPHFIGGEVDVLLTNRGQLQQQNAALNQRVLELSQVSQQFLALRQENERLRGLLGSRRRVPHDVLVAELVGIVPRPNSLQIVIDKGTSAGAYIGQAVLDAQGLFGQVVSVDRYTAHVLLLSDRMHAVPVEVNRSGVRGIAAGTGERNQLRLEDVPTTADIREGDLVVSSGLGGRFPRGYPVGRVSSMQVEPGAALASVLLEPTAHLDRSRHVLLVFPAVQPELEDSVSDAGAPKSDLLLEPQPAQEVP
jgi:rod shape-determining protein MreC